VKKAGLTTVWIIGDQLTPEISSLSGLKPNDCVVLMIESLEHAQRLPFHKQKLVLIWSAMRHFAEELRGLGYTIDYHSSAPNSKQALHKHIEVYKPSRVRVMETAEYGLSHRVSEFAEEMGLPVEITPNNMFLSDRDSFQNTAEGRKSVIMETFYRKMRVQTGLLMDGDKPVGGQWNYDKLNRMPASPDLRFPGVRGCSPDSIALEVKRIVEREFPDHFGSCDDFYWPVTRSDARAFFQDFLENRLDLFGPYEDAMVSGERVLYHSLISPLINIGLLEPLEICRLVEERYYQGKGRLNSVEGFIRQIIGWREFVYQIYHWKMPEYIDVNFLEADLPLPDFYWNAETDMYCIKEAVETLIEHGINHHIQRLMITGNFALIAGINPQEVNDWYWLAYADAYEWVVTPNVLGMSLYADGGIMSTKPYAASANYINRMSDYCRKCLYNPSESVGEKSCPFNSLYWDFLARNRDRLADNPRMALIYKNMLRQSPERLRAMNDRAGKLRKRLQNVSAL
jgi:deoxyribodipyrimidine photolyase-related protein